MEKLKIAAKSDSEEKETAKEQGKRPAAKEKGILDNPIVKSMTRTAGNTIVRSLLGVLGLGGTTRRRKSLF